MRIQAVSSALLVCCFSTLGVFCRADPVQIETLYSSAPLYYGMLADFGGQLGKPDMVNLMLIRDDINLCTFPEYLRGITDEQRTRIPSAVPVGFFISRNRCSIEQKARVLLEMQKTVSDRFQYLFVFNVDSSGSDDFETFKATSKNTSDLESVSVIQLPYRQAAGIYRILDYRMRQSRLNPHLLDDGNEQWNFILNVQLSPGGFLPESLTPREINSSNFVWFRFVLFSLLILSPCCRAGYLWYASGGRIHLRRNDRGRIVGIQYIPPMAHWLGSGRAPDRGETVTNRLTIEQFDKLPEIEYAPCPSEANNDSAGEVPVATVESVDSTSKVVNPVPDKEPDIEIAEPDIEIPTEMNSSCAACSICIDDFEAGEKLTKLPRCSHLFHRECLKPWLMERQGCCPLCKTAVIEESVTPASSEDENQESPAAQEPNRTETATPTETRRQARQAVSSETDQPNDFDLRLAWNPNRPI